MKVQKLWQVVLILIAFVIAVPACSKGNSQSAELDKLFKRMTEVIEKSYGAGQTCASKSECDVLAAGVLEGIRQANRISDPRMTRWIVSSAKSSCETGYEDKLNNTNRLPALLLTFEQEKIQFLEKDIESSISELTSKVATESYTVGKSLTSATGCANIADRLTAELVNVRGVTTPLIREFSDLSIKACAQGYYDNLSSQNNWSKIEKLAKEKKVVISETISRQ